MQDVQVVSSVATLPFGLGLVGADRHLEGSEKAVFLGALANHQHPIPDGLWLPIDCMDERPTVQLADGTSDPEVLAERRAGQLAGGTVLAVAKAAVAADVAYLRDAQNITDAYEKTYELLQSFGIADAAHEGCGASNFVEKSVTEMIDPEILLQTFVGLGASAAELRDPLATLRANKRRKLEAGFYSGWQPAWHANFVTQKHPENFSYLQTADDAVHGHHASGLLLVQDGHYFAKNAFAEETGRQSFALTFGEADRIADLIGTPEERELLKLAFRDDSLNVANHIVAKGLEVAA